MKKPRCFAFNRAQNRKILYYKQKLYQESDKKQVRCDKFIQFINLFRCIYLLFIFIKRIKNFKIDKFGDFSSDIDFKTKMDIFRDDISLIINQCHTQATEGSLRGTLCVRQPRSASKRSALVLYIYTH